MSNETLSGCDPEWCIAVFARNEEARIGECLIAIARATDGVSTQVILLINGSSDKTAERALGLLPALGLRASVYKIGLGCKSHAMNVFVHDLRPRANVYFFVDATSFVEPNALRALAGALDRQPDIAAVSGLPINGRGAAQMRRGAMQSSKLFGQMFAVRQSCLDDLSTRGRRLPIGLYRCDGLFVGFIHIAHAAFHFGCPRLAFAPRQHNVGAQFDFTFGAEKRAFDSGDVKKECGQLAFLDALMYRRPLDGHEHGDPGG